MLLATHMAFLLAAAIISNPFQDILASKIDTLDMPLVVRNGTGPIDLSCIYNVKSEENGLVIKWYHNMNQIYQWIPPMPPQDVGVISGFAEYPEQNLKHPNSLSIIRLKLVTVEMSGEYTCLISTFQEEDLERTRMIVYEPETSAKIHVVAFNETHLNVTCVVNGAHPRPVLKFYVEGFEVDNYYDQIEKKEWYRKNLSVKRSAIIKNSLEPMLLDCEISIPYTDYKRRERTVYYPTQSLSQMSAVSGRHQSASFNIHTVNVLYTLVLLLI
ncbi:uncharacterized protein LOC143182679 [Calliopsis andreniformis]|uniref:uncharacterized protein LOC143182679 n=1 Tax=Calliopsis andreniformis TaxID=337506 RepID=UPI003FCDC02B